MTPRFIDASGRSLFCLHCESATGTPHARVLVLPPFAEELNKCRLLLARTARALAAAGCEVLLFDLTGTGDSAGDFGSASWADWVDDVVAMDAWLAARAGNTAPLYLAVRSGALLLAAAHARLSDYARAHVMLWQPVADGGRFLQQFLRLRVVASRLAGQDESLPALEARFAAGEPVEVAGYAIAPALASGLAGARLTPAALAPARQVSVLEFRTAPGGSPTHATGELAAALAGGGGPVAVEVVAGEQFWATQELAAPESAIAATLACLGPPAADLRRARG
jgi:exosortase A-associated hydrolase 2